MAESITERLAQAALDVVEYESRVAALREGLTLASNDEPTVEFLTARLADREGVLARRRQVLGNVIQSYCDQQAEARLAHAKEQGWTAPVSG